MHHHGLSTALMCGIRSFDPAGPQGAVVAAVNGEMVAMLATSPCKADLLDSWSTRFRLDQGLPVGSLDEVQQHAQVDACIINPVFSACVGALLAGASTHGGIQAAHSPIPVERACNPVLSDLACTCACGHVCSCCTASKPGRGISI